MRYRTFLVNMDEIYVAYRWKIHLTENITILSTGKYIGEGFDEARLDTLFLTMPISWKGTLTQYAGRLNRDYEGKKSIIIYDYADIKVPVLEKMYKKRLKGYKLLHYELCQNDTKFP